MKTDKPYSWIPTLYIGESLPFSAVMLISVIMFQEMGLTDSQITLYTGWLGLPWVIKPIWSPFVDNIRTKRWWILMMQMLMGSGLALVAMTIPTQSWLQWALALFMIIAFASATHDISADGFYIIALSDREQEFYVGIRNTFYRIGMVLGQGGLVWLVGKLQTGGFGMAPISIPLSWTITFLILSALMIGLSVYHMAALPICEGLLDRKAVREVASSDGTEAPTSTGSFIRQQIREFGKTLMVFITKPHIVSALCFILLFRLPEGLLTKIVPLFLKRTVEEGGLGMSDVDYGIIYGTLGVIGLLLGGIIGGWLVSRYGLRRMLWPLVLCITLPDIVYVYLSYFTSSSLWIVATCVCIEQIGYGLGFAAYTLYLVTFSRGERSTAVFSICTAGQYLGGVMLPGMVSGFISEGVGYSQFFCIVMAFCLVTFAVTAFVKIDGNEKS